MNEQRTYYETASNNDSFIRLRKFTVVGAKRGFRFRRNEASEMGPGQQPKDPLLSICKKKAM